MKTILILSASTGAGHVRAGEALRVRGAELLPHARIEHVDIATLLPTAARRMLVDVYNTYAGRFPRIWGFLYEKTARPKRAGSTRFPAILQRMAGSAIRELAANLKPDHIIATHFLPALFLDRVHPLSVVVTDFAIHPFWLLPNAERYFVSTAAMKDHAANLGIPHDRVHISGIPIHPSFHEETPREELRRRYGIPLDQKTVLVLSGGYGLLRTDRMVRALMDHHEPLTIVSIAGKNIRLKTDLECISVPTHIRHLVVGWTDAMHDYMRMADVVIGKPGGLTTTECIALQKPFIAIDPIPGHEDANVQHLEEKKYGVLAKNIPHLASLVSEPFENIAPGYVQKIGTDRSADIIWQTILNSTIS